MNRIGEAIMVRPPMPALLNAPMADIIRGSVLAGLGNSSRWTPKSAPEDGWNAGHVCASDPVGRQPPVDTARL